MNQIWETIIRCRICDSGDLTQILDMGEQPPANSLYTEFSSPPPKVPLRLCICNHCGCVQLKESVNPVYLFGSYLWVTGTSKTASHYSQTFAMRALEKADKPQPFVVEIASNDGTFLREFQNKNSCVLGVDPAENIAAFANSQGVETIPEFFTVKVAENILRERGTADIAIARNVIPHVKEIHSVIEGLKLLIGRNGIGIIEFHDSNLLLKELHYDYIYHEHLFYFTLSSMQFLLAQHDLFAFDLDRSPISGGSWVIYFSSSTKQKSTALADAEKAEGNKAVDVKDNWLRFCKNAISHRDTLKQLIIDMSEPLIAYGASARSSTLLNFAQLGYRNISAIIDKNHLKHGLYTPGSAIPVISFEEGVKRLKNLNPLLLLAWNFSDEIMKDLKSYGYAGEYILPLPGLPRKI